MSQTTYPHTDVAYWVIPDHNGFSVEVISSENHPTTVSPFATASDAGVDRPAPTAGTVRKRAEPKVSGAPAVVAEITVPGKDVQYRYGEWSVSTTLIQPGVGV